MAEDATYDPRKLRGERMSDGPGDYQVGEVVNGHKWTGSTWEPVDTYQVGEIVNGHRWTGTAWEQVSVAPPPPPPPPPPPASPSPSAPSVAREAAASTEDHSPSLDALHKKARAAIESALEPGEKLYVALPAEQNWALVATDQRVLIFKSGMLSGATFGKQLNSWHYAQISGIEDKKQMSSRALILQVPGANPITKFGRMDNGAGSVWEAANALMVAKKSPDVDQAVARLRQLIAEHQRPSHINPAPIPAADPADQVRRLAQLRDEGLLTEEEFQLKKRDVLGL